MYTGGCKHIAGLHVAWLSGAKMMRKTNAVTET